jgi:hypothetical protein
MCKKVSLLALLLFILVVGNATQSGGSTDIGRGYLYAKSTMQCDQNEEECCNRYNGNWDPFTCKCDRIHPKCPIILPSVDDTGDRLKR